VIWRGLRDLQGEEPPCDGVFSPFLSKRKKAHQPQEGKEGGEWSKGGEGGSKKKKTSKVLRARNFWRGERQGDKRKAQADLCRPLGKAQKAVTGKGGKGQPDKRKGTVFPLEKLIYPPVTVPGGKRQAIGYRERDRRKGTPRGERTVRCKIGKCRDQEGLIYERRAGNWRK